MLHLNNISGCVGALINACHTLVTLAGRRFFSIFNNALKATLSAVVELSYEIVTASNLFFVFSLITLDRILLWPTILNL